MSVALVRRSECVPKKRGSRPIVATPARDEPSILPRRHAAAVMTTATEQKFARLLASGLDVIVDGLPRLLRQLKSDGSTGLLLPHCGAIDRIPARCNVLDPKCNDIAARSLLSSARLNIAKSRVRPSICNRVRIDQTCFGRS